MSNDEIRLRCDGKTQSRTGKIARLPYKIREEVNRRLRDNVPGDKICEWLNRLPAAKAVCKEFARRGGKEQSPITPNQLSEWRRGGFRDWLVEQRMLEETREMTQWSMKLAEDSGGELCEGAAVLLSVQLLKVLQGIGKFQIPSSKFQDRMESDVRLQASKRPSSRETSNFKSEGLNPKSERTGSAGGQSNDEIRTSSAGDQLNAEHRTSNPSEPCAPEEENASRLQGELLRVADPRSGSGEVERMESSVRLLASLVKCLSGIRRGDQNRVRLALSEKKLALRSKVVAIECEKYKKEKTAQEELERKERAVERRKKSGLSERGKMHLLRGRLFDPEGVIKERRGIEANAEGFEDILKEKFGMSDGPSSAECGVRSAECSPTVPS